MAHAAPVQVLCFGEILWDFLPGGVFPGGAPFNVAYHLCRLGVPAAPVSAVGDDVLGRELRERLVREGIPDQWIAQVPGRETGRVRARFELTGEPRYEIARGAAWDAIPAAQDACAAAGRARALVYGSLAFREPANQATLERLLLHLPGNALRVLDVNLRPPFDDPARVHGLARHASLLKLNAEEARRLGGTGPAASVEDASRAVAAALGVRRICVTDGAKGAGYREGSAWTWQPAPAVTPRDPVGAGDGFLAGFLARWLAGGDPAAALEAGCRVGAWVATQDGATPRYPGA